MKKFVLIETNSPDPATITVCDTEAQRDAATLEAVFGCHSLPNASEAKAILDEARENGGVEFEGDPPIYWFEGEVTIRRFVKRKT